MKLSALRQVIEAGNKKKKKVYLRMNAFLELKPLHPRKTMIYLQLSLCVFDCMACDEVQRLRLMLVID